MRGVECGPGPASTFIPETCAASIGVSQTVLPVARATALGLSDERIDQDLPAFKAHLAAMGAIQAAELPLEAEPASIVVLKPARG